MPDTVNSAIPRVIVATDLPGFGRVALSVCMPILSAMGVQPCPLPTAVLSTHGAYPQPSFLELTANMRAMVAHWETLQLRFDGLLTGFLGSLEQFELVTDVALGQRRSGGVILVDPVLGDHGRLYGAFTDQHVACMQKLCAYADIITPNLTEAALLLGRNPNDAPKSDAELREWLRLLSALGPRAVVITSCPDPAKHYRTGVAAFDRDQEKFWRVGQAMVPASYPGTGDVFASVLLGAILTGNNFCQALDRAVQFTGLAVLTSHGSAIDVREGLLLERILDRLGLPFSASVGEF